MGDIHSVGGDVPAPLPKLAGMAVEAVVATAVVIEVGAEESGTEAVEEAVADEDTTAAEAAPEDSQDDA